jgi:hypothetical protein
MKEPMGHAEMRSTLGCPSRKGTISRRLSKTGLARRPSRTRVNERAQAVTKVPTR